VLQGIGSAMSSVEDMTEWLGTCNLKLRYMREELALICLHLELLLFAAVKEKKEELENLKSRFVRTASEFLGNYFASLVDFMISDSSCFSQSLDNTCLVSLRKAYCRSLNLLLQREAQKFSNELQVSTRAMRNLKVWPEASATFGQTASTADTSAVSEEYLKMLTHPVPLLVDESSFFANLMCFKVPALTSLGSLANGNQSASHGDEVNYDDLGIMDIDNGDQEAELATLNECLKELLDGAQEYFYAVVDWVYKIDPLHCISLNGITIGRNERNVQHLGVVPYIPRFATLAAWMEQCVQGQSRDLVDQAHTKFISHQNGVPRMELRKMIRATLTAVDKSVASMHERLQKDLTSDELLSSSWAKCKKKFAYIVATVYPTETPDRDYHFRRRHEGTIGIHTIVADISR
ncbi:Exocyst complex component SEC3A-like protein, partial [Drosera capensis]